MKEYQDNKIRKKNKAFFILKPLYLKKTCTYNKAFYIKKTSYNVKIPFYILSRPF